MIKINCLLILQHHTSFIRSLSTRFLSVYLDLAQQPRRPGYTNGSPSPFRVSPPVPLLTGHFGESRREQAVWVDPGPQIEKVGGGSGFGT